jgi:hypothetical protein
LKANWKGFLPCQAEGLGDPARPQASSEIEFTDAAVTKAVAGVNDLADEVLGACAR